MGATQAKLDAVRVTDSDPQVVLHPANDDLFVRTGRQVIGACRLGISVELWLRELDAALAKVREWAAARADSVRACYCAPRVERIMLFFCPKSEQFDFELADGLADLNVQLVKDFNVGMVEVSQVPWEELDRFVNLELARLVYGEQRRPHPPVEA